MTSNEDDRNIESQTPTNEGDYAQMLDDYSHFAPPAEGEVLKGYVLKVTDKEVIVDFGYKSEGLVPIAQFQHPDGSVHVKAGDTIDVMVDRSGERPEGYVLLSHEKASRVRAWDDLERAQREGLTISGRVLGRTKGGLNVDVGVPAFMPGSQISVRPVHNLDQFVGQDIPVKIVKVNRRRGNVVVSRKLAVAEEETSRREAALHDLQRRRRRSGRREEPDRLRRVHRPGRNRRPAACQRYVVRPDHASFRSAARRRRDHCQV